MTDEVPSQCSVCSTPLRPGTSRCIACGAVFGGDNRCPHCHGLAGIRKEADGYVCMACNRPRSRGPGTEVFMDEPDPPGLARAKKAGLRSFGVLSIAGGVLAATLVGALVPGAIGLGLAIVLGGVGVGIGALSMRSASRSTESHDSAILGLAQKHHGILTPTTVAQELGLGLKEAEAELTKMADGTQVVAEITADGRVEYIFREIRMRAVRDGSAIKVRVEEEVHAAALERVEAMEAEQADLET